MAIPKLINLAANPVFLKHVIDGNLEEVKKCWNGNLSLSDSVIPKNISVNIHCRDPQKHNAVYLSAINGHIKLTKYLLQTMGVKFEYNHKDVEQLFDTIIENDNTDVFKYLIAQLPDINKKWSDGKTLLHKASLKGKAAIVAELLKKQKIDVEVRDNQNRIPFYYALVSRSVNLVQLLRDRNVSGAFDAVLTYFQDEKCRNDAIFFFSKFELNNDHIIKAAMRLSEKDFVAFIQAIEVKNETLQRLFLDLMNKKTDIEILKKFIAAGVKLNSYVDHSGNNILHKVVNLDYYPYAELLTGISPAKITEVNDNKLSPLKLAFQKKASFWAEVLWDIRFPQDNNILRKAREENHPILFDLMAINNQNEWLKKLNFLIDARVRADLGYFGKQSAIEYAIKVNSQASLQLQRDSKLVFDRLLNYFDPNNPFLKTLLQFTYNHKQIEFAQKILDKFDLQNNIIFENRKTLLHKVISDNNIAWLSLLTKYNLNFFVKDAEGNTPLDMALDSKNEELIRIICEYFTEKINSEEEKQINYLILHFAIKSNQATFVRYLINNGFDDVTFPDEDGVTPLQHAFQVGNPEIIALLKSRLDMMPNKTEYLNNELIWAVKNKRVDAAKQLLNWGASADATDEDGNTVLYHAAKNGSETKEVLDLLKNKGAHIDLESDSGEKQISNLKQEGVLGSWSQHFSNRRKQLHALYQKYYKIPLATWQCLLTLGGTAVILWSMITFAPWHPSSFGGIVLELLVGGFSLGCLQFVGKVVWNVFFAICDLTLGSCWAAITATIDKLDDIRLEKALTSQDGVPIKESKGAPNSYGTFNTAMLLGSDENQDSRDNEHLETDSLLLNPEQASAADYIGVEIGEVTASPSPN